MKHLPDLKKLLSFFQPIHKKHCVSKLNKLLSFVPPAYKMHHLSDLSKMFNLSNLYIKCNVCPN